MIEPGVIASAFARDISSTSQSQRQDFAATLKRLLKDAFAICNPSDDCLTAELDRDEPRGTPRVLRIICPLATSVTLAECTRATLSEPLAQHQREHNYDLVLQPRELYVAHGRPGLAVFDMDSTLIQQEVIDELARAVGLYDKVAAITEAAMRGEAPYTDFEASLRARVALLEGVPISIWEDLKTGVITFTPGAMELVKVLQAKGWKTAVLSGGFTPLAKWVKETLGLDYAYANHLVSDDEKRVLTGELVADMPIIHAQKKRELLLQLAQENGVPIEQTIAVGDGSNDLLMMGAAGMGIAFNAKPKVQLAAPARLNGSSLLEVAYVLGMSRDEIIACLYEDDEEDDEDEDEDELDDDLHDELNDES